MSTVELYHNDMATQLKLMKENSVHVCITDPPYGISIADEDWDNQVPTAEMWKQVYRVLKPGGFLLSFSSPKMYHRMATQVDLAGFETKDMLQWIMVYKRPIKNNLKSAHEPIYVAQKPYNGTVQDNYDRNGTGLVYTDANRIAWDKIPSDWPEYSFELSTFGKKKTSMKDLGMDNSDVKRKPNEKGRIPPNVIGTIDVPEADRCFYTPRVSRKEKGEDNNHPTAKPIALMEHLVSLFSQEDDIVLDPFMGSGTTGIACSNLNRSFQGIEMSEEYFNIAENRISAEGV